uniref:Uncharacterized protein n=1 Tax=Arundo donax TaxID=35708 RepID=A0A0A9AA89_ARUDO
MEQTMVTHLRHVPGATQQSFTFHAQGVVKVDLLDACYYIFRVCLYKLQLLDF